jgi:hypothetical protein
METNNYFALASETFVIPHIRYIISEVNLFRQNRLYIQKQIQEWIRGRVLSVKKIGKKSLANVPLEKKKAASTKLTSLLNPHQCQGSWRTGQPDPPLSLNIEGKLLTDSTLTS